MNKTTEIRPHYITAAHAKREGRLGLYASVELSPFEAGGWVMVFHYKSRTGVEPLVMLRRAYAPEGQTNTPRVFTTLDAAVKNVQEIVGNDKRVRVKVDWTKGGAETVDPEREPEATD